MTGTNTGPHGGEAANSTTPWSAAYTYAAAMRELSVSRHNADGTMPDEVFDVPTMLITYALADYAWRENLTVNGPSDLGNLSGMELWERLATGRLMDSLSCLSPFNQAVVPAEGEPLSREFHRMMDEIDRRRHEGPALAGQQSAAAGRTGERAWYERGEDGQALVALALLTHVPDEVRDAGSTPLRYVIEASSQAREPYRPARPYELSEYMAADSPQPERGDPQWAVRVMQGHLGGRTLLVHYLCSIDDRELDLPDRLVAPRLPGESDADYTQRTQLAQDFSEAHVMSADYSAEVADELMHIRPSDAGDAVEAIITIATDWWTTSRYEATIGDLLPAMTVLLDGLVAPERRADVQRALDTVAYGVVPLERARLRIVGAARDQPYEALHLAAAFAGALYQIPACVPDQRAEFRHLSEASMKLAQGDIADFEAASRRAPAPTSQTTPAPSATARQADARKKKARKASRKARKQGRR
ncbi:hypothetical protein [Nocardia miyunensis]|uniref:hypothetical protein n=1 Tax=Nocardia miyunensis TaxID=282684 RepID=UPI00082BD4BE|nr:hypothetical protein [Nocardia miyunensis]